jgi:hypothetical protein
MSERNAVHGAYDDWGRSAGLEKKSGLVPGRCRGDLDERLLPVIERGSSVAGLRSIVDETRGERR